MDSQIERIMRSLRCTRDEAEAILADDKRIDRGEQMDFDLSPEAHKLAMKNANSDTKSPKTTKSARKPTENPEKESIITEIALFLARKGYNSVEITNKTRQIGFKVGENSYELTLIAKRKAKSQRFGAEMPQNPQKWKEKSQ